MGSAVKVRPLWKLTKEWVAVVMPFVEEFVKLGEEVSYKSVT